MPNEILNLTRFIGLYFVNLFTIIKNNKFMRNVILILAFVCSSSIFGQSVRDLDEKNGFRDFKFGTGLYLYLSQVERYKEGEFLKNPDITTYKLKNVPTTVWGVKTDRIRLTFFKNVLSYVSIDFGSIDSDFTEDEYNKLLGFLESLYGDNYYVDTNRKSSNSLILKSSIWDGRNVRLELIRMKYKGSIIGYISIFDKNLHHKMLSSEL